MPTPHAIALMTLALLIPTMVTLPFILHILNVINDISDRLNTLESTSRCPLNR